MERRGLPHKLDEITTDELGIGFDSSVLWDQLDTRLSRRSHVKRRLLIAACITLLIFLVPFDFLKQAQTTNPQITHEIQVAEIPIKTESEKLHTSTPIIKEASPILVVPRKDITPELASVSSHLVNAVPVPLKRIKKINQSNFSNEDISVIQASLGEPKAEEGRKVTVRAQLYTASDYSQINFNELKIKLNAKNK